MSYFESKFDIEMRKLEELRDISDEDSTCGDELDDYISDDDIVDEISPTAGIEGDDSFVSSTDQEKYIPSIGDDNSCDISSNGHDSISSIEDCDSFDNSSLDHDYISSSEYHDELGDDISNKDILADDTVDKKN